jgi:hypothetical protein
MTDDLFGHTVFEGVAPHIVDNFLTYHRQNPHVYEQFKRFAYELKKAGRSHFGAKAIAERIRFETAIKGNDDFKLNNNYVACMARLMVFEDPTFSDFFQLRSTARRAA